MIYRYNNFKVEKIKFENNYKTVHLIWYILIEMKSILIFFLTRNQLKKESHRGDNLSLYIYI